MSFDVALLKLEFFRKMKTFYTLIIDKGACTNHVDSKGGGGLKISEKCPRYRCKLVHVGGEGAH